MGDVTQYGESSDGGAVRCFEALPSVVVPAHNAAQDLPRQLHALRNQDWPDPFEVLVVANRCADATRQVAESFASSSFPVHALEADARPSAAYARNVGARRASGTVLLFCDADDEVSVGWVREMCRALEHADFVGAQMRVNAEGVPGWLPRTYLTAADGPPGLWDGRLLAPISASLGVRRTAFEAVGGFDERFPGAAGEDTDLAIRLAQSGFRGGVASGASFDYRITGPAGRLIRRKRSYEMAEEVMRSRYGGPPPADGSRWATAKSCVRGYAREARTRRRPVDPRPHIANALLADFQLAAIRSAGRATGGPAASPSQLFDFTAPITLAAVGGLGFAAPTRQAAIGNAQPARAKEGQSRPVREVHLCLSRLVRSGDRVADVGAGVGLRSVHAGMLVGATGSVVAIESDPDLRRALVENVERHGATGVVRVEGHLPLSPHAQGGAVGFSDPLDVLMVGSDSNDLEGFRQLVDVLAGNPTVALLVEFGTSAASSGSAQLMEWVGVVTSSDRSAWLLLEAESTGALSLIPVGSGLQVDVPAGSWPRCVGTLVLPDGRRHQFDGLGEP